MLDAVHVVKLGGQVVDDVRRRVQQDTLGHRGRVGDPHHEVTLAWHGDQKLHVVYNACPEQGRRLVTEVLATFPTCPIPEIARFGRILLLWKTAILAYFDTDGASNGPAEEINGVIEMMRRVARGFRNLDYYRLRALLAAGGYRPWRKSPTHAHL